jgi:cytochrome c oxidase cbb3-type subunit 3
MKRPVCSPRHVAITLGSVGVVLAIAACRREERQFRVDPSEAALAGMVRRDPLQPGAPAGTAHVANPYENNAYAQSEGQRLFSWYNCSGCHANGGGGMGPALMDAQWLYGSAPENIYATIVQGRPNGMPSFAGKMPSYQVWQLVTYVRSLSALTPASARSARNEHMMVYPGSQSLRKPEKSAGSSRPLGESP